MSASTRLGFFCAVAANVIWGLFPIFWNLLRGTSALELVSHRIVWAFVFSMVIAVIRFRLSSRIVRAALLESLRRRQTWAIYSAAAFLIAINWGAFLYAVTNEQVLLSSLGYYISPLFNVLLGVVVLGERLSAPRWGAVGLAGVGVTVMTVAAGQFPWVSLLMAGSFAGYALVKKKARLDPMNGLFLETLVLLSPTLVYLAFLYQGGAGDFGRGDPMLDWMLIIGGFLTLVPLAFFSAAAQRIPLTLIGVLQFIGPTLQFFVGAFYFGEPMSTYTLVGFAFVWSGVAVFLATRR
ncbi:EamA family transporter RarD [Stieleria sp.]|uniref:EamA family transporter RarD n=1 Tax=Stieleria sp. TaxID=2795976 RepID=UPI0035632451